MLLKHLELEAGETILHTVHKHWFIMLMTALQQFVLAFVPIIVWVIAIIAISSYLPNLQFDPNTYTIYVIFFECCWLIFVWMLIAYNFTVQWLDVWIITDRRVIAIEQISFFRRHLASFRLERLQDIAIDIDGILATFLDYGTLEAQTASESGEEFRVRYMPHPEAVKAAILKAADDRIAVANASTDGVTA